VGHHINTCVPPGAGTKLGVTIHFGAEVTPTFNQRTLPWRVTANL
jgi:hypothetical protein